MLRGETRRLARLARDLGTVSRAEEGADPLERRPSDLTSLVEQAVARGRGGAAARGVALRWHVDPGVPPLHVDPERIGQVLANLLDNAVRHARTAIGVTAGTRTGAGPLGPREVYVRVRDDGEGIPADAMAHVFERFYRADNARSAGEGSGIGLTIARAIVSRHGGRIEVETVRRGTEFTVVLPLDGPPQTGGDASAPAGHHPDGDYAERRRRVG
jgi:signal transduction histidine kinase